MTYKFKKKDHERHHTCVSWIPDSCMYDPDCFGCAIQLHGFPNQNFLPHTWIAKKPSVTPKRQALKGRR